MAQATNQKAAVQAMERALKEGAKLDEGLSQLAEEEITPALLEADAGESNEADEEEDEGEDEGEEQHAAAKRCASHESSFSRRATPCTACTYAAWLHVSGATDFASPA